jgi:hypothetical protein
MGDAAGPYALEAAMTMIASKYMIWGAAFLLIACAVLHSLAWMRVQADFASAGHAMAALVWFLLAIDWLVIAGLWVLGAAQGTGARASLLLSAIVPIAVSIGLVLTLGPRFFAIYVQLSAAALVIAGALRMG